MEDGVGIIAALLDTKIGVWLWQARLVEGSEEGQVRSR